MAHLGENWTVRQELSQANRLEAGMVFAGTLIGIAGCALSERFGICAVGIPAAIGLYGLALYDRVKTRARVKGMQPDDVLTRIVG
jgi:hypothetical protein